jgi:hypothetical protein
MGDSPTTKSIIQNFIRPRGCQEPFVSKIISPKALRKKFWKERAHEKDVCPKGPGAGGGSRRRYSAFKLRRCSRTIQQVGWRRVCRPAILLENRKDGLLRLGTVLSAWLGEDLRDIRLPVPSMLLKSRSLQGRFGSGGRDKDGYRTQEEFGSKTEKRHCKI